MYSISVLSFSVKYMPYMPNILCHFIITCLQLTRIISPPWTPGSTRDIDVIDMAEDFFSLFLLKLSLFDLLSSETPR